MSSLSELAVSRSENRVRLSKLWEAGMKLKAFIIGAISLVAVYCLATGLAWVIFLVVEPYL